MSKETSFRYLPYLDGLRAVSILLVLGFHGMGPVSTWISDTFAGWSGVDVFFVISGFLITALLVQEQTDTGTVSFKGFYIRRVLRIAPAYYVFLAVRFLSKGWAYRYGFLIAAVYLTNWDLGLKWDLTNGTGLDHTWSLAVEEQYYLLWPLTFYLVGRRIVPFVVGTISVVYVWRFALLLGGASWIRLTGGFDTRIDCIMTGCLAALLWARPQTRAQIQGALGGGWMPLVLALALFCSAQTLGHPSEGPFQRQLLFWMVRLPLHQSLVGLFILALCNHPTGVASRLLSRPVLVWIGRLSYSLYLWHGFVFWGINGYISPRVGRFLPEGAALDCAMEVVRLAAALLVASTSFYLVERPFLRLKKLGQPKPPSAAKTKACSEEVVSNGVPRQVEEPVAVERVS